MQKRTKHRFRFFLVFSYSERRQNKPRRNSTEQLFVGKITKQQIKRDYGGSFIARHAKFGQRGYFQQSNTGVAQAMDSLNIISPLV